MNARPHQPSDYSAGDQRPPSLSSTASSDKSAAASNGHHADAMRAEAARQWGNTTGDSGGGGGGGGGRKMTTVERLASFRSLLVQHWHAAITYCAVFWSFGMCVAFLGPTLLDLGCITSSDMRAVSWVFLAQLLCSLIGASAASYLVKRYDERPWAPGPRQITAVELVRTSNEVESRPVLAYNIDKTRVY